MFPVQGNKTWPVHRHFKSHFLGVCNGSWMDRVSELISGCTNMDVLSHASTHRSPWLRVSPDQAVYCSSWLSDIKGGEENSWMASTWWDLQFLTRVIYHRLWVTWTNGNYRHLNVATVKSLRQRLLLFQNLTSIPIPNASQGTALFRQAWARRGDAYTDYGPARNYASVVVRLKLQVVCQTSWLPGAHCCCCCWSCGDHLGTGNLPAKHGSYCN